MLILLAGAIKNYGDFLIEERGKKLIEHCLPNQKVIIIPRWKVPSSSEIQTINSSNGVINSGGPFYKPDIPFSNKFFNIKNKIRVPIRLMGGGWKGLSGSEFDISNYRFQDKSIAFLKEISSDYPISCRDYLTKRVLTRNGIDNVAMTGCPTWYDIDSLGKEMTLPASIKAIAFSVPNNHLLYNQALKIMSSIKKLFPEAILFCSMNRGIAKDKYTDSSWAQGLEKFAKAASIIGYEVRDISCSTERASFYNNCQIHIGYRVHSHIKFLSERKPSYLINEDGRGSGVENALNVSGFNGFFERPFFYALSVLRIPKASNSIRHRKSHAPDSTIVHKLIKQIQFDMETGFSRYAGVGKVIDEHYKYMEKFIKGFI